MDKPTADEPSLLRRLREHFGRDPATLPVVEQHFDFYERPNLHLAIEEILRPPDYSADLRGIVALEEYRTASLARLSRQGSASHFDEGPVEYADVALAGDLRVSCVKHGMYLVREKDEPLAVLVFEEHYSRAPGIKVEVMAAERDRAERFLRLLTRHVRHGRAFRGHVLSLQGDCHTGIGVQYHHLPHIGREDLILPDAILRRIERHTLSFSRHAERLRAAQRHLKRGILLNGLPGTGKTLTAMYLVSQMPGRSVLLITGEGMGLIEAACKLARLLAPATVVLEDVDLIGTEREFQTVGANALLFELLNQMDGLADDVDILFLLTTNRPDILEPALASRPGRIDQAIEIPLPDADCRRRLLALYGRGLRVELIDPESLIARTAGVSGAFIRELLRKAAVFAAEEQRDGPLVVRDAHIDEALTELLVAGGALTQSLLGASGSRDASQPPAH
jgi:cell division protease FtsH